MENKKALNDNSLEQINGGMIAHLEEISGGDYPDPSAYDSDHE